MRTMNARNLFSELEAESSLWTQLYLVILQRETPYHKLKTARNTGAFADYANAVCCAVSDCSGYSTLWDFYHSTSQTHSQDMESSKMQTRSPR